MIFREASANHCRIRYDDDGPAVLSMSFRFVNVLQRLACRTHHSDTVSSTPGLQVVRRSSGLLPFRTGHGRSLMAAPADRLHFQCHRQFGNTLPVVPGSRSQPLLTSPVRVCRAAVLMSLLLTACAITKPARAAELAECRTMLIRGDYESCIHATHEAITKTVTANRGRCSKLRPNWQADSSTTH